MSVLDDRIVVATANLRDVGGVVTADGSMVRRGQLFRGGYLSELTADELATLTDLGLQTIVDLRRPAEVEMRPNPELTGVTQIPVSVSIDDNEFAVIAANITDPTMGERALGIAEEYYRQAVVSRLEVYRIAVGIAVEDRHRPLLFHCTAGKDRTGIVAALLLKMLGVADDIVIADYVLTNEVRREWFAIRELQHREQIAAHREIDIDDVDDDHLRTSRAVFLAHPEYIRATLASVVENFRDWDTFAERGLGLDPGRLHNFRRALLV